MLNCDKKINILTLVLSEKKILKETKNHNPPTPPLPVKWSVPKLCNSYDSRTQLPEHTRPIRSRGWGCV